MTSREKKIAISGIIGAIAIVAFVSLNDIQNIDELPKESVEDTEFEETESMEDISIAESFEENQTSLNITQSNPDVDLTDPERNIQEEIEERIQDIEEERIENPEYEPAPREWITSGPFQIDRSEYVMGEKVFLRIGGLEPDEKGQVAFLRPQNDTHYSVYLTIPFDGQKKNVFNYYFEPRLTKSKGVCSEEDLIGKWAVVFRGTEYQNLYFKITNKTIPGNEEDFHTNVC